MADCSPVKPAGTLRPFQTVGTVMAQIRQMALLATMVVGSAACGSQAVDAASGVAVTTPAAVAAATAQAAGGSTQAATAELRLLDGADSVSTRYGTVALLRSEDEGLTYLIIDGKPETVPLDFDHMALIALVRWADRDGVLLESDCSGSSCGWPTYRLLELKAGSAPQLLQDDAFMATDMASGRDEAMSPVLSMQGDGSVLIGTAGDERAWFVYRPGQLVPR
jgi:hypothetical protein